MEYFVYILQSEKLNRYYTGSTSDIDGRMAFQKDSEARKFTSKSDNWILIFTITCKDKHQSLAIEKHIKAMKSKKYIVSLMKYPEMVIKLKQNILGQLVRASDC